MVLGMDSVQDLINLIFWDRRLVVLPDGRTIVILNPTLTDRNMAAFHRQCVMKEAIAAGTPTEESLLADAREGGGWTEEDDLILKEGNRHIEFLESEKINQKFQARKNGLDKQIRETREKLKTVLEKKQYLAVLTAEYMANEAYIFYMIKRIVKNEDGTPFFKEEDCLSRIQEKDTELINKLVSEVVSEGILPTAKIREIARSVEWRMFWTLNREDLAGLFNTPISNLSGNQRMLIYWSRVYDLAYESTERPDDDVIIDDNKFDLWLQTRGNEKKEGEKAARAGTPDHHEKGVILDGYYVDSCTCGVGSIKAKGHGERPRHINPCLYGTYKKYTRQEKDKIADEIYGRNSKRIQQLQTNEQMRVANAGTIDEKDLRNQKSRLLLGSKQEVHGNRR